MRAATVVQVLQDFFYVLLQLLVVAAIILSFKFYCKSYCMFYFTCDRSFRELRGLLARPVPLRCTEVNGHSSNSEYTSHDFALTHCLGLCASETSECRNFRISEMDFPGDWHWDSSLSLYTQTTCYRQSTQAIHNGSDTC